ncbi:VOC family protein [Clostridium bowmanii]|uniref:VOC family protein n=1 Tax=Clostridium bowmanii TaxID=132925 RepID=UPI001FD335E8|nr:VOC family protein [Clostridium bowmanii]
MAGQQFNAISAGPYFKFNPSISLMVTCYSVEEVNTKWKLLSEGGTELMSLGEYPFSKWYGWIQDRYGLSWQLMLVGPIWCVLADCAVKYARSNEWNRR